MFVPENLTDYPYSSLIILKITSGLDGSVALGTYRNASRRLLQEQLLNCDKDCEAKRKTFTVDVVGHSE